MPKGAEEVALSIMFGVCKFHSYLYGCKFNLVTNHKTLTTILRPKKGVPLIVAAHLQKWALKLAAYTHTTSNFVQPRNTLMMVFSQDYHYIMSTH